MCAAAARSSLSKLFPRKSYATGFERNKGGSSRKGVPREWRSPTTLYGYPVDPVTGSVQKQIVNALHLGEREKASTLLSHIGYSKHMLNANHFIHVLEYCALTPDPLFGMEIWKIMEEKGVDMNNKCHLLMIQALCNGGYIEEAFNLMNSCGETPNLYPTLRKYNTLLGASADKQSVAHASKCLDLMEHDMLGKDEITYIELLKLAVLQNNLSAAHTIWKEYAKYYSFNLISLKNFIWSFTKLGDLGAACEALRHLVGLVLHGGFTIKKSAEDKMVIPRLDVPIPFYNNFQWNRSNKVDVTSVPTVYENDSKTDTCENDTDENYCHLILSQINFFLPLGLTQMFLVFVICYCLQLEFMQQKNLKPHDSTFADISAGCSNGVELDLAEAFLDQMAKCPNARPYNKLLEACDLLDQPEHGVHVFGKMKQLKVAPNIKTYELLFSLFGNVIAPYENGNLLSQAEAAKRINLIEDDMVRNGIQHSYVSISNFLKALGLEGMISGLLHYLCVAENQFTSGTPIYNSVAFTYRG